MSQSSAELAELLRLRMRLDSPSTLQSLLEEVLDATMALEGGVWGNVQIYDEANDTLQVGAHRRAGPEYPDQVATVGVGDSICAQAMASQERIIIEDMGTDQGDSPDRAAAAAARYRGVDCLPLIARGSRKPLGILSLFFREPFRPSDDDLLLTDLYARLAADMIDCRLAEQRMQDREEHFRLALEAGNMGIWEWDSVTHLIRADKTHQALFGLPPQDDGPLPNELYWERMDPEEASVGTQRAVDALESGRDVELELRVRPSEGVVRWIAVSGRPRYDGTGSLIGISYDITDRKEREEMFREQREWLRAVLDQIPGAVGLFDKDGGLLLRGGPLSHLWDDFSASRDPTLIDRWRSFDAKGQLLPFSDYPSARALRGQTASPGMDFVHTPGDGSERWYRVSAAPFCNSDGTIAGGVAMMQDVDEEKRGQTRLRQSEGRLRAAVSLAKLGLYSWNPVTNELSCDAAVKAMWGLAPEAAVDWSIWREGVHPDDRARVDEAIACSTDPAGDGVYDIEYRVIGRSDGEERWVATRGQMEFENGRATSLLGVSLDITNRKHAEQHLEQLVQLRTRELGTATTNLAAEIEERRQVSRHLEQLQMEFFHASRLSVAGQMAATIAHELSQPLAAVVNSLNTIRRLPAFQASGAEDGLRELTEDAATQAERANQIIRRLRNFIRRGFPQRRPEQIKPLVEEAVVFAMTGPEGLGVSVSYYFDPLVPEAVVDRIQIQQVIANLVRNSLQAMKDAPRHELTVATQARPDKLVEIAVTDSGHGVKAAFEQDLFEPFMTTKQHGMGLGLSICRSIVEAHGGDIRYRRASGGGATFSFTIPTAGQAAT
jgi:PAS domain S-box-containing protein